MRILTHQGPGYRSVLMGRSQALDLSRRLREDTHFTAVQTLESQRHRGSARYFVVCVPTLPEKRRELLEQFHQDRVTRAEEEGPRYLWVGGQPAQLWHVLTLSGSLYQVDTDQRTCSCRDFGVSADNGLLCKHLLSFDRGLGQFVTAQDFQRLQQHAGQLTAPAGDPAPCPPAPRSPVAVPVAA